MQRRAVFPGTFDPFTNGHRDIVDKGLLIFDEIIIAIGVNALKKSMFPLEKRLEWIQAVYQNDPRIRVDHFSGLTINYCLSKQAGFLLRGLRTIADFEYEKQIAFVNSQMTGAVQSIFVISEQKNSSISSTIVRDLIAHKGDYSQFIPEQVRVDEAMTG